jgi:hypothetical protein
METAVRFKNTRGLTLHGVLHHPEGGMTPGAPAVLWMSAGQKDRLGAWRMNLVVCRRLAKLGVPAMRFDFHGIGDSEGEHPHGQFVMDLYGYIQTGGMKDDVVCAARHLLAETGASRLVFGGLCGGAISALFAGSEVRECWGHYLVDLPVTISSAARQKFLEEHPEELLRTNPEEAEKVWILYLRKVLNPSAWRRLLAGESDYKLLAEALRQRARGGVDRVRPRLPSAARGLLDRVVPAPVPVVAEVAPGADPGQSATGEVRNERVAPALKAVLDAGQRVRLVTSSTYHPTFMAYFGDLHLPRDRAAWRGMDLTTVPDANHIFSLEACQKVLFDGVESLVQECAGGALPLGPVAFPPVP